MLFPAMKLVTTAAATRTAVITMRKPEDTAPWLRSLIAQDLRMGHPYFVKLCFQGFGLAMALG